MLTFTEHLRLEVANIGIYGRAIYGSAAAVYAAECRWCNHAVHGCSSHERVPDCDVQVPQREHKTLAYVS